MNKVKVILILIVLTWVLVGCNWNPIDTIPVPDVYIIESW